MSTKRTRDASATRQRILDAASAHIELLSLQEWADAPTPIEDGETFADNALIKARAIAAHTGFPAIADDSGICVDELNGMPGILSARWAGRHGDDEANLQLLLDQLADTPDERLNAHFTCVIALVRPDGSERVVQGEMHGRLVREPRGANGFGYDPIFVPDGFSQTSAELTAEQKDAISHRGKALRVLVPLLND